MDKIVQLARVVFHQANVKLEIAAPTHSTRLLQIAHLNQVKVDNHKEDKVALLKGVKVVLNKEALVVDQGNNKDLHHPEDSLDRTALDKGNKLQFHHASVN